MTAIERAKNYISQIKAISGKSGHRETFKVASILRHGFALSIEEAMKVMLEWNKTNARPPWSEGALHHKLLSADGSYSSYPFAYLLSPEEKAKLGDIPEQPVRPKRDRWPKCDEERVIDLLKNSLVTLKDFYRESPAKPSDLNCPYELIDFLFCQGELENPWLCLGRSVFDAVTQQRSHWEGKLDSNHWQYIVPNPMKGPSGKTATGKESPRAKSNVLERRFIVIECDFDIENHPAVFRVISEMRISVQDVCTTILTKLSETARPAMAVNSGGKSIHGWFPVLGASRRAQIEFFRDACLLGADPQMAHTNQWTRFPTGIRENNNAVQAVEYFDPDPFLLQF